MKIKVQVIFLLGLIALFISSTIFFSFYQARKVEEQTPSEKLIVPEPGVKEERLSVEPSKLVPSRPEDFGMVVIPDGERSRMLQGEYDALISDKVQDLKQKTSAEVWGKVQQKIKEDPSRTQEKIKLIDDSILKLQAELGKDPSNDGIKARISRLMMLKSIARSLPGYK